MEVFFRKVVWRTLLVWCFFFVAFPSGLSSAWAAREDITLTRGVPSSPSPDIVGIRPLGMGNAGLALADGPEAFFINPAGLGLLRNSYLELGFHFHPSAENLIFNASVADGKTNPSLAGGLSYSYYKSPRPDDGKELTVNGHIVRLGTTYRIANQLFIGATLKVVSLDRPFLPKHTGANLDLGLTWSFSKYVSMAIVGYNLFYKDDGEMPIAMGVGLAFQHPIGIRAAVDWVIDFQSRQKIADEVGHELRAGLSYTIAKMFSIRAGYQFDHVRDGHFISFGLGFKHKRFGLEGAYRQELASEPLSKNRFLGFTGQLYF